MVEASGNIVSALLQVIIIFDDHFDFSFLLLTAVTGGYAKFEGACKLAYSHHLVTCPSIILSTTKKTQQNI